MDNSAMRRYRSAVVAVIGAGLLAACTSMPTSGPVVPGRHVQGEDPVVYAPPDPPTPGDDQEGIVDGFIDAMGSYEPNYEVARQFLTPEAETSWQPTEGAIVYEGAKPAMALVNDTTVELTYLPTGTLRPDRSYVAETSEEPRTITLNLQQVDGEWRIADPPPGLIISDFNFGREFRPYDVYFFDPTGSTLVPDPVYIPRGTRAPATLLARALLDGPTDDLAPAVSTAFPEDSELGVDSVPIDDQTARVELGQGAGTESIEVRDRMAAQLVWTLSGVEGVEQLRITTGDTPLTDATSVSVDDFSSVDPAVVQPEIPLYAVSAEGVVQIDGGEITPVPGSIGTSGTVREVAVEPSGERAVVIDESATSLAVADLDGLDPPEALLVGEQLAEPAWDRRETVWALGLNDSGRRVPLASVGGAEVEVSVDGLDDRSVYRLEPSPDGTRVAMVIGSQAYVGLVIRDVEASSQVQITTLRPLVVSGQAIDVAWRGPGAVAVLLDEDGEDGDEDDGGDGDGVEREVWEVPLNGTSPVSRGSVGDATALAGMPRNPLVVTTGGGELSRQDTGVAWVSVGEGLTAPDYP